MKTNINNLFKKIFKIIKAFNKIGKNIIYFYWGYN